MISTKNVNERAFDREGRKILLEKYRLSWKIAIGKNVRNTRARHYNNCFRIRTTDKFLCRKKLIFRLKKDEG
jgi:hypothetical protein